MLGYVKISAAPHAASGAKKRFDDRRHDDYYTLRRSIVRQFIYGVVLGVAAMYLYARFDPPKILAYLNAATESAAKSTSGYGGTYKKK